MNSIDHLIYGVPDLESGMDEIESLLGVRPVLGGRHAQWGTQNALLSLGSSAYLEIMAADPDAAAPGEGVLFGLDQFKKSRMITWVLRTESIDVLWKKAVAAGVELGPVSAGTRVKEDGASLTWRLSDPSRLPLGGAVPFLIDWGAKPHPSSSSRHGGELIEFRIGFPDPGLVTENLSELEIDIPVRKADSFQLLATIRRTDGLIVELG